MTTFKEVFEVKTTPNLEIKKYRKFNYLPLLAMCSFVLIAVLIRPSSTSEIYINPLNKTDFVDPNVSIQINPLHKIDLVDPNVTIQETTDLEYPFIKELKEVYPLLDSKIVYIIDNQLDSKCGYNRLDSYQLYFDNFVVSFSKTNRPYSNFSMTKDCPQYSKINQVDVAIYQYENTYYASFEYNHMFFEIESTMTIEELVGVLKIMIH